VINWNTYSYYTYMTHEGNIIFAKEEVNVKLYLWYHLILFFLRKKVAEYAPNKVGVDEVVVTDKTLRISVKDLELGPITWQNHGWCSTKYTRRVCYPSQSAASMWT
jgi:hypothetical protein